MDRARTKTSTDLKSWPSPQDYNEAIQALQQNIGDKQLAAGSVEINALGLPRPLTGSFASVYRIRCDHADFAVRCFLRDLADQHARYKQISDFVQNDSLPYTVSFNFVQSGIRVAGRWLPILKMDWVEGLTLDFFVEHNLGSQKVAKLADSFLTMCQDLREAGIAHGDLQHGNIIVNDNEELRLVDYDGMFVPKMVGMQSNELGHRNYQHPSRTGTDFGAHLDNFSAWVIYCSLKAIAIDPSLYRRLGGGDDCLLFRRDDFQDPEHSYTFGLLENHANKEIVELVKRLRAFCKMRLSEVPPLNATLPAIPQLKPLPKPSSSATAAAARPVVPPRPATQNAAIQSNAPDAQPFGKNANLPDWLRTPIFDRTGGLQFANNNALTGVEPELSGNGPRYLKFKDNEYINPKLLQLLVLFNPFLWVVFTPLGSSGMWAPLSLLGISIALIVEALIWSKPWQHRRLLHNSQIAIASGLTIEPDPANISTQILIYEFIDPNGVIQKCKTQVSDADAKRIKALSARQATVLFNPTHPQENMLYCLSQYKVLPAPPTSSMVARIDKNLLQNTPRRVEFHSPYVDPVFAQVVLVPLVLCICQFSLWAGLCFGLISEICAWWRPLRDRLLMQYGVPAIAIITKAETDITSANIKCVVDYEFRDLNNKLVREHIVVSGVEMSRVQVGQEVAVLYDANDPSRNVLYQFSRYIPRP